MRSLLVIGSLNADLYVEIPRLPIPGETLAGTGNAVRSGGKGANQAAAAARLGRLTWLAGRVGTDAFAAPILTDLAEACVDTALVKPMPGATGQALILLQSDGDNAIILSPGANHTWGLADGFAMDTAVAAAIPASGLLLLQREIPGEVNLAAARIARSSGVPVILDAGGEATPIPPELLIGLHTFSPNESELARLTGLPVDTLDQVEAAARTFHRRGVHHVLVKLGARGCLSVPREGTVLAQPAFPVPVVDTTGAGDCFTAAYAVALLEGQDPARRLRFACAAAALCVQTKGALPAMPKRAQVEAFLEAQP